MIAWLKQAMRNRLTRRPEPEEVWELFRHPERISAGNNNNLPARFGRPELEPRSVLVHELIGARVGPEARVLELGPSVGRNLAYLHERGFTDLHGVEINAEAIDLMAEMYPELHSGCGANMRVGAVEQVLPDYPDRFFEVTFSLGVLQVIHSRLAPALLSEVARVTASVLVTIEDEQTVSDHHFPRNYRRAFERLGFREVYQAPAERVAQGRLIPAFQARVFERETGVRE